MLAEENTSLLNFGRPEPDMQKEQYIQNCFMDYYVASEDDFTPEKAKAFFEANHPKLNQDHRNVFNFLTDLIRKKNNDGKLIF